MVIISPAHLAMSASTIRIARPLADLNATAEGSVWRISCAEGLRGSAASRKEWCVRMIREMTVILRVAGRIAEGCACGRIRGGEGDGRSVDDKSQNRITMFVFTPMFHFSAILVNDSRISSEMEIMI